MAEKFNGVIKLDIRDSVPDWKPFELKKPPEGAPNVLIVLYDDTGLAAWSPYGGRINMPTMDLLADNGITYTIHDTTGITYRGADGKTVRARLNSVAVTPLEPLLFNSEQSTVDRITAIQRIRPQGAL